ncbi:MAG: shikimate kinase [Gemmatimonadota bacterium]
MSERRHVVLVGLPGAGKTVVGQRVAELLGAPHVETDAIIVRQMQMPIKRIFGEFGEMRFRELERQAVRSALQEPPAIISPGGGWAAQPGQIEVARTSALLIYLRTMALTAAKRIEGDDSRPLVAGQDVLERIRDVLQTREPFYTRADREVKTDARTVEAVAEDVAALARAEAGW